LEKIAIITDSASDLNEETAKKYNISVLPFRIIYKDREYMDNIDISPEEVYNNLKKEIPKSSFPSMDDMEKAYRKLENEGYTHVLAVVLSSGLSGISNALKIVSEKHKNLITYICDSKSISLGERIIVEECCKLISQGKTFVQVVDCLPEIKRRNHLFFIVGTLEYLIKGGRIGLVAGTIGEFFNIKPIISVNESGKYFTFKKVRYRMQSLNKIVEIGSDLLKHKKCDIYIVHGGAEEDAHKLYERFSKLPNIRALVFAGQISAVSGMHTGPGTIGVCFKEFYAYE